MWNKFFFCVWDVGWNNAGNSSVFMNLMKILLGLDGVFYQLNQISNELYLIILELERIFKIVEYVAIGIDAAIFCNWTKCLIIVLSI